MLCPHVSRQQPQKVNCHVEVIMIGLILRLGQGSDMVRCEREINGNHGRIIEGEREEILGDE